MNAVHPEGPRVDSGATRFSRITGYYRSVITSFLGLIDVIFVFFVLRTLHIRPEVELPYRDQFSIRHDGGCKSHLSGSGLCIRVSVLLFIDVH